LHRWTNTARTYYQRRNRTVCYLSAEFLMGPQLGNNLVNLGIYEEVKAAVKELDWDLDVLLDQEEEPGLGNGGLGRLAACLLDSLATLGVLSLGYRGNTVNLLRLWRAEAIESFNFQAFNTGNSYGSVLAKIVSENTTKVLYPNDESPQGKQLRLQQQIFFVSCALQDMIRMYLQRSTALEKLHEQFVVQLNDAHPAIAVAELMRLLVDDHLLSWEQAWTVTQGGFSYTNHTLMPEALERWPIPLFGDLLPRHLEIICETNRRSLAEVRLRYPDDDVRMARMSLVDESGPRYVRMAHLACVGSHAIHGVAKLHSDLLKTGVLRDFHDLSPEKITNVTSGVAPRRFLLLSNPELAALISGKIGDGWPKDCAAIAPTGSMRNG
jgi:glycogen phosphorylase